MFSDYAMTLAALAFFSTTVDDFAVLLIFFAREYVKTNDIYHPETSLAMINITLGQLIGFTIIVGISLAVGIGLGQVVEEKYLALIGFLPILIGLFKIYELGEEAGYLPPCECCPAWCCCCTPQDKEEEKPEGDSETGEASASAKSKKEIVDDSMKKADDEKTSLLNKSKDAVTSSEPDVAGGSQEVKASKPSKFRRKSSIGSLFSNPSQRKGSKLRGSIASCGDDEDGVPIKKSKEIGAVLNDEALDQIESVDQDNWCVQFLKHYFFCCFSPLTMEVGLYALLFGTDNIAIYVALFSVITVEEVVAVIAIFYAALLVYIAIAITIIVQCPPVGKFIGDYAKYLVPLLLIGLGLYILHDSVAWVIPDP